MREGVLIPEPLPVYAEGLRIIARMLETRLVVEGTGTRPAETARMVYEIAEGLEAHAARQN